MTVYVVAIESRGGVYIVGVCSSMREVVRLFGTTWHERVTVSACKVDTQMSAKAAVV